jgi:leucyl-tRNA synthetase
MSYKENFSKIEEKWRNKWESDKIFQVEKNNKPKYYNLEMYPYPSGSGLHVGHAFNYTIGDINARFKRMNGFNVLYPMGFDSFGLPAENAAIKNKSHPKKFTEEAIANFIKQQKLLGLSYDWNRMVQSHDPKYYKWDQWIFLKMLEKGLAYKKKAAVNWCSKCNSVLANEQVHNGKCWRHSDTEVEIKYLVQWFLKTTEYADEMYEEAENLDWPHRIKAMQKNWIGKSIGTEIQFKVNNENWPVFTTRPDTIYGVTFVVVSAQHPRLMELVTEEQKEEVLSFLKKIKSTSEKDSDDLEKEGAFTGTYAMNPVTGEKIPVWTGNFVVADYGSGMVMAVPAHDQRDFEFAKKYNISIKVVISPNEQELDVEKMTKAYTQEGKLINSEGFNGNNNLLAINKITEFLEKQGKGKKTVQFKLRDWLISRQRFWGTPIPIVYCDKCGTVPIPEDQLPVILPENLILKEGGNPLEKCNEFVNTSCPKCGGEARRETDTMDTFVNSSWYFLRYTDNKNEEEIFDTDKVDYWMPVDMYIGGAEHACMHLIYARFYTKFLRDIGLVKIDEPFKKLFNQGMVHGTDGFVMSKSRGNVVDPMITINEFGADATRMYLVSVAAPDKDFAWSDTGLERIFKFISSVFEKLPDKKIGKSSKRLESKLNKAIKNITENINDVKYNQAVISLRKIYDVIVDEDEISREDLLAFIKLLHPFCPHITEELWHKLDQKEFISLAKWPKYDISKIDEKIDALEEMINQIQEDVNSVLKLAKIEKPNKVVLIVADNWKYEFISKVKEMLERISNPGEIIKELMQSDLKQYGKEISKMVPAFAKDRSKMPKFITSVKDELKALEETKETLEKEFITEISIELEAKSENQKAKFALPGKPAIYIE